MVFHDLLMLASVVLTGGLALFILAVDSRSFGHRMFALGMLALALRQACAGLSMQATLQGEAMRWMRLGFIPAALLPGTWLLFSLSFARANFRAHVRTWRWGVLAAFVLPLALVTLYNSALVTDPLDTETTLGSLSLGWSGHLFLLVYLVICVAILVNLEGTLRASTGSKRWQLKFLVLGLGGVLAIQIYTISQALLFSSITLAAESLHAGTVVVAEALILVSLGRDRQWNLDIYLSPGALYNTVTISMVGIYLLVVAVLAKTIAYFGGGGAFPLGAFFVFLALLGLSVVLFSDQWRHASKRFISSHFSRPRYDYRKEWTAFTRRTTSVMNIPDLCAVVSRMVSELLGIPAVTVWLYDEATGHLTLGGSTVLSESHARQRPLASSTSAALIAAVQRQSGLVDCVTAFTRPAETHMLSLHQAQIRYALALTAGHQLLGVMTLSTRLTQESFSAEDAGLLTTIADQAAAHLLNLRLSQRLAQAKEMQAFQTLSTFVIHDLKNLASKMSLGLENLPDHFDDACFREDLWRMIADSVTKMNVICRRLSPLSTTVQLHRLEVDLNALVRTVVNEFRQTLNVFVGETLHPLPTLLLDPEQIESVLINLLLNAHDALGPEGTMWVTTRQDHDWAIFMVQDDGCGMSREFMEHCLFQPFRTTKSQGSGIGLFQTKMIVEAHQGRLEVESEEGKGSLFRVLLPLTCRTSVPDVWIDQRSASGTTLIATPK